MVLHPGPLANNPGLFIAWVNPLLRFKKEACEVE
jgi:hypothetical protein